MSYNTTSNGPAPLLLHKQRGQCDVHRLVDGDTSSRLVEFCNLCKAWLCDDCRGNWARRMQAFYRARRAG
jgi:hypothetical protein